jgi:AbrB family looped-hinge helix DNA binding protein
MVYYLSTNGRFTIPAQVRRQLGIRAGDVLDIVIEDDRIVLSLPKQSDPHPESVDNPCPA